MPQEKRQIFFVFRIFAVPSRPVKLLSSVSFPLGHVDFPPPSPAQVASLRTSSMSSLNSQESSNDICKLTDKQQAEYRDAYREYIAQMAQVEMSAGGGKERPVQPHPGQFLQAAGSDDKGVGGQERRSGV